MSESKIQAAFAQTVNDGANTIVYLPEGKHKINATKDGKPATLDVVVDHEILAGFAHDLSERQSQNVRPFAGFDHETGAASFIPVEFRYEDGKGLLLDVEWTSKGKSAVEGKDYSYFSPTFLIGKDNKPLGLTSRGEIGSLVNTPAFESIPRIAAKSTTETMKEVADALVKLGLVGADIAPENVVEAAQKTIDDLKAQADGVATIEASRTKVDGELVQAKSTIEALQAEIGTLKGDVEKARDKEIEKSLAEAVEAGRIAPKDEATLSFWRDSLKSNASAITALQAIPAKDLTSPVIANRTETTPTVELKGIDKVQAAFKAQKA